jgi:flagellar basal body-associated protein FliL
MTKMMYIRLLVLILVASMSLLLFSYSRSQASSNDETNGEDGKCTGKKAQTEFILWESITHNLLSLNR